MPVCVHVSVCVKTSDHIFLALSVLLYIRKESEEVFDALMLKTPTLKGLVEAVSSSLVVSEHKLTHHYAATKRSLRLQSLSDSDKTPPSEPEQATDGLEL